MVAPESTSNLLLDQREGKNLLALGQARNIKAAQRVLSLGEAQGDHIGNPLQKVSKSKK
jgi:hypothetical protein